MSRNNYPLSLTKDQKYLISDIKKYLGKEFTGNTSWEAFNFIHDNLRELCVAHIKEKVVL